MNRQRGGRAGGDYYDFIALDDGRIGLVVADASGHGAPAAVVMAVVRALLHTSRRSLATPRAALEHLGSRLYGNMPPGIFATACWLSIDPARLDIVYALAGHCPPIIVRADGTEETLDSGGGLPLGLLRDVAYPEGCARLAPGDTLFVYTDGLTEAMNERGEMFSDERLRRILTRLSRVDAATLSERMLESFDAHRGEVPAADDTTWVVVRAGLR